MIGSLAFATPLLLTALIALPVLWWILRAVPPAPIRRRFPGVALLLGLKDDESQTDKTPWWLLLLRMAALAAAIIGFAGPVLNPQAERSGEGPLLILMDGSWASARDWSDRLDRAGQLLDEVQRAGRPVALVQLTDLPAGDLPLQSANAWVARLPSLTPAPYAPDFGAAAQWAEGLDGPLETYWIADGLEHEGRDDLIDVLTELGPLSVFQGGRDVLALAPPRFEDGAVRATVTRLGQAAPSSVEVIAHGLDPAGIPRDLARATASFEAGARDVEVEFALPPELRNRITRFEIAGIRGAGTVALTDDALQRRQVALISAGASDEQQALLSPLHYLRQALDPTADLIEGALTDMLLASPDVVILADIATLSPDEDAALTEWVAGGGLLVRFAGPRLAASDIARDAAGPFDARAPARRWPQRRRRDELGRAEKPASLPRQLSLFRPHHSRGRAGQRRRSVAKPDPGAWTTARTIASLTDGNAAGSTCASPQRQGRGRALSCQTCQCRVVTAADFRVSSCNARTALRCRPGPFTPEGRGSLEGTVWTPQEVLEGFGTAARPLAITNPVSKGPLACPRPRCRTTPAARPLTAGRGSRIARQWSSHARGRCLRRRGWPGLDPGPRGMGGGHRPT